MKTGSPALVSSLTNDHHLTVGLSVSAEWKHNRFYRTVVDNTPTEDTDGYDIELFPIESITKQDRPKAGINKAIANQAFAEPEFHAFVPAARYYMCSVDDQYKYWQSPLASVPGTRVMTNCAPQVAYVQEDDVSGVPVPRTVYANKIHFTVENTYAYPDDYDVQVKTTTGGSWTTVSSDVAIPSNGLLELWFNGTTWTTTKDLTHATTIAAVRLVVNKMLNPSVSRVLPGNTDNGKTTVLVGQQLSRSVIGNSITGTGIQASTVISNINVFRTEDLGVSLYRTQIIMSKPATATNTGTSLTISRTDSGAYFNLIELGAALELDLTKDVIDQSTTFSMGEADFISPLGNISTNTGKLTLMNETGLYNNENAGSALFGLIDKGVKLTGFYNFNADSIQEFEMYSDTWDDNEDEGTISVNMKDNAQVFMDVKPRVVLWQNMSVQEIVWRICDMIGFTDYVVTDRDLDPRGIVDIFWTDGQKTAWEIFSDLSRATQTGIFFDSYGKLNVMSRGATWDETKAIDYTLRDTTVPGSALANIVSGESEGSYESNKVTINWKPTAFSEIRDNVIPYDIVWQPDGDLVLRASEVTADIPLNATYITFGQKDGSTWPFKGYAQIQGEWIAYEGKRYQWYNPVSKVKEYAILKTLAEQKSLDAKTGAFYRHINQYTGQLLITERGAYNTQELAHTVKMVMNNSNWRKTLVRNYVTNTANPQGHTQNIGSSTYTIELNKAQENDYSFLHRGSAVDAPFKYLGTKIKINTSAHKSKIGGLAFNLQSPGSASDTGIGNGAGYYVEVTATVRMTGTMRKTKNEIAFYSMKADGTKLFLGGEKVTVKNKSKSSGGKTKKDIGAEFAVPQNTFIELDVIYTAGSNDNVKVYANGKLVLNSTITSGSGFKQPGTGRWGIYSRGHSKTTYEYLYASANSFGPSPNDLSALDGETFYDRISKGYYSNQWQKDWAYDTKSVRRKIKKKWVKAQAKYNQRIYEEFGPIAHEIRKFDVAFTTDTPSMESKLYFSNKSQVIAPWYWGDPHNGHFFLCNTSRMNAVVNGDDTLTTGGNGTINHKLFVYGRVVKQQEQQQIIKTDDRAVRRRGIIESEYDSPWIQNEAEANDFADWLTKHWTTSDSEMTLEIFGNPLIEVADIVRVIYDDIDDNYYVIGVNNEFQDGVKTKLTLRKV